LLVQGWAPQQRGKTNKSLTPGGYTPKEGGGLENFGDVVAIHARGVREGCRVNEKEKKKPG